MIHLASEVELFSKLPLLVKLLLVSISVLFICFFLIYKLFTDLLRLFAQSLIFKLSQRAVLILLELLEPHLTQDMVSRSQPHVIAGPVSNLLQPSLLVYICLFMLQPSFLFLAE